MFVYETLNGCSSPFILRTVTIHICLEIPPTVKKKKQIRRLMVIVIISSFFLNNIHYNSCLFVVTALDLPTLSDVCRVIHRQLLLVQYKQTLLNANLPVKLARAAY